MKKKLWIIFSFSLLALYFYLDRSRLTEKYGQWEVYERKEREIFKRPPKTSEKKKLQMVQQKKAQRDVSNLSTKKSIRPLYKGREVLGTKNITDLKMVVNEINPNWKEYLTKNLLNIQNAKTKVFIRPEKGFIRVKSGHGHFVEQVIISYHDQGGRKSSFRALVDSSNGKVLKTWDRSIHEDYMRKRNALPLAPYYK